MGKCSCSERRYCEGLSNNIQRFQCQADREKEEEGVFSQTVAKKRSWKDTSLFQGELAKGPILSSRVLTHPQHHSALIAGSSQPIGCLCVSIL